MPAIASLSAAVLAFVLPDACLVCCAPLRSHERHVCARCLATIEAIGGRTPLPAGDTEADTPPGEPRRFASPPEAAWALTFSGTTRTLIHALKYGGRPSVATTLCRLAAPVLESSAQGLDAIVPVPLHTTRLRQRGFNQSGLIAGLLAAAFAIPVLEDALVRRGRGTSQTRLTRSERLRAASGFAPGSYGLAGQRVLLVDDVVTTGTTLAQAARALSQGGAEMVVPVAVAGSFGHPAESG